MEQFIGRTKTIPIDQDEIHAAMVDRMDQEIGKVIARLQEAGVLENTLIMFLSDNGASAEIMIRDDGHNPLAAPGSADTHLCLGPGWSNAANTPFRRHKTWVHEGGIRTPFIVHWPDQVQAKNELRTTPGHVVDIMPTLMEITGQIGVAKKAVPNLPGESLVHTFANESPRQNKVLWWSHEGNRAIRSGDWKLVKAKGGQWELFDLATDPTETKDLVGVNKEQLEQLSGLWNQINDDHAKLLGIKKDNP